MLATRLTAGVLAGLIAGLVFGVMMHMTLAPTPDGTRVPMMLLVAQVVGSQSLAVGWVYHLFNSAIFGAIFGLLVGSRPIVSTPASIGAGAAYGLALLVIGGLILMPLMLGLPVFAPLTMPGMLPVAMVSLVGHLGYGIILGGVYPSLVTRMVAPPV